MPMKNPPHPGRLLLEEILQPLGLTVASGAIVLGVSRQSLKNLVIGQAGITPEMALRLGKAFGTSAQTWLRTQSNYDLTQALGLQSKIRIRRYRRAKLA